MFESRRPDITPTDPAAGPQLIVADWRKDDASLVVALALHAAGAAPSVETVDPADAAGAARIAGLSPRGRPPVLQVPGATIWEPIAILEWAAELAPALWPAHARRRALARCLAVDALTGMAALRERLPLDWHARYRRGDKPPTAILHDVHRLLRLWDERLSADDGFLFAARPVLADVAMVPLAARLRSYGLWPREPRQAAYAERLLSLPETAGLIAPVAREVDPPASDRSAVGPAEDASSEESARAGAAVPEAAASTAAAPGAGEPPPERYEGLPRRGALGWLRRGRGAEPPGGGRRRRPGRPG